MIPSRTLREEDYTQLVSELCVVGDVVSDLGGWDAKHHSHRRWEYALALHTLRREEFAGGRVADVGGGTGYLTPILYFSGFTVSLYEKWQFGDEKDAARDQIAKIRGTGHGSVALWGDFLTAPQQSLAAVFCLSTLEHVEDDYALLDAMAGAVVPGGLLFLTVDFAPDATDHYVHAGLRKRIYNEDKLNAMAEYLGERHLDLVDGDADWEWTGPMVNDYTFASLAVKKDL